MASATGIVKETKKLLASEKMPSSLRDLKEFTAKDVFDAAKAGDELALISVNKLAEYLGIAMSHIACVVDPDVFLVGGGVSKAGDFLIDAISRYYVEKHSISAEKHRLNLQLSETVQVFTVQQSLYYKPYKMEELLWIFIRNKKYCRRRVYILQ